MHPKGHAGWNAMGPHVPPEDPRLYDVARRVTHSVGMPWTDPRTGITYQPPKKRKKKKVTRK